MRPRPAAMTTSLKGRSSVAVGEFRRWLGWEQDGLHRRRRQLQTRLRGLLLFRLLLARRRLPERGGLLGVPGVVEALEFLGALRLSGHQVLRFADVLGQVEQPRR